MLCQCFIHEQVKITRCTCLETGIDTDDIQLDFVFGWRFPRHVIAINGALDLRSVGRPFCDDGYTVELANQRNIADEGLEEVHRWLNGFKDEIHPVAFICCAFGKMQCSTARNDRLFRIQGCILNGPNSLRKCGIEA